MILEKKVLRVLQETDASADEISELLVERPKRVLEVLKSLHDRGMLDIKSKGEEVLVFTLS